MKRRAISVLLVVAFCLAVVATRAVWEGRSALDAGDRALAAGDNEDAIRWWRRAARWYAPLAPHVPDAYDRLERLGAQAEKRGDLRLALSAWQGVRGSILATRSFFVPHEERLAPANRHIADLLARLETRPPAGMSPADLARWHYGLLARNEAPSVGWTAVALLGLAAWIGGAVLFALRGISRDDRLVRRPAVAGGLAIVVGLVVWLLGLYNA